MLYHRIAKLSLFIVTILVQSKGQILTDPHVFTPPYHIGSPFPKESVGIGGGPTQLIETNNI